MRQASHEIKVLVLGRVLDELEFRAIVALHLGVLALDQRVRDRLAAPAGEDVVADGAHFGGV